MLLTALRWIAMKCCGNINGPQRITPTDSGHPLTFAAQPAPHFTFCAVIRCLMLSQWHFTFCADIRCLMFFTISQRNFFLWHFLCKPSDIMQRLSTSFGWISRKFGVDIHGPKGINPSDLGEPLIFFFQLNQKVLHLLVEMSWQLLDCQEILHKHQWVPRGFILLTLVILCLSLKHY